MFLTCEHICPNSNLDTSSTPGGSIEKVSVSSIPSRYLVDRSSFCSWFWWFIPRHLQLSTCFFSTPTSILTSTPLDTSVVENYWSFYLSSCRDPIFICSISLNLSAAVPLPNTLFSLKSSNPLVFRSSLGFNHLVRSLFPSFFMHCMF